MSPCGCAPRAAIASRAALRCRTGRQRARWPSPRRSASLSRTPVLSVRKKLPCQLHCSGNRVALRAASPSWRTLLVTVSCLRVQFQVSFRGFRSRLGKHERLQKRTPDELLHACAWDGAPGLVQDRGQAADEEAEGRKAAPWIAGEGVGRGKEGRQITVSGILSFLQLETRTGQSCVPEGRASGGFDVPIQLCRGQPRRLTRLGVVHAGGAGFLCVPAASDSPVSTDPCCCLQRRVGCRHGLPRLQRPRAPAVRVEQPALRLHLLRLRRVRRPGLRPRLLGQRACSFSTWAARASLCHVSACGVSKDRGVQGCRADTIMRVRVQDWHPAFGFVNNCDGSRSHSYCDYRQQ